MPLFIILCSALEKQGVSVSYLPVGLWGALHLKQVKDAITAQTKMIILSAANSETGVMQPDRRNCPTS